MSRRAFLFLGASAAVYAALPTLPVMGGHCPAVDGHSRDWVAFYRAHFNLHIRRNMGILEGVLADTQDRLRIQIPTSSLVPTQQGAWLNAVREERQAMLCEAECALEFVEGRWDDADGQVLRRVP